MNIKSLRACLALGLALVLSACAAQEPPVPSPAVETPAPTPVSTPVSERNLVWTDQVAEETYLAEDGTVVMTARFVLPDIVDAALDPAWSAISGYYRGEGEAYLQEAAETAAWASGDYEVAAATGFDFAPYAESSDYRVSLLTGELVSFVRDYHAATGGAHPVQYQFSEQFDLATGARLTLGDFISDVEAVKGRVLALVREQAGEGGYDLAAAEDAFHEDYFYLTEDGLVFYYQPDVIAPRGAGPAEFALSYGELEDLLTEKPAGA